MIVPILTDVVTHYGGTYQKALVIPLFAGAALIARPFSGTFVDIIGRKPIILFGAAVCVFMGITYALASSLIVFLVIRFFHGFSTGFTPVGNTSYLADISPIHRRGEAMGVMGMMTSLGFALGPNFGKLISNNLGWDYLFIASSVVALISILLILRLPETRQNTRPLQKIDFAIKKENIFDRSVMVPFVLMILTIFPFGVAQTAIFAQTRSIGFPESSNAIFFFLAATTSIAFRFLAGKASDKYGRRNVMILGILCMITAGTLLALSHSKLMFITASIIYGVSIGINSPTIFAWTMDLADPQRIGRAMSTLFIAVEVGVILGGLISGLLMDIPNDAFLYIHLSSVTMCLIALTILLLTKRDRPPTAPE